MWLNCTRTRVSPANMGRVVSILEDESSMAPLQAARGFRGLFLIESTEAPGELTSITWWANPEDGQTYLAGPECLGVIATIQEYLLRPLERSYFEVHIDASSPPARR